MIIWDSQKHIHKQECKTVDEVVRTELMYLIKEIKLVNPRSYMVSELDGRT